MIPFKKNPFALAAWLIVFCLGSVILYFGKTLFIPLSYGLLSAIVLYPFCQWLEKKGWRRSMAISAAISIIIILFVVLLLLLLLEINSFRKDIPVLAVKLKPAVAQFQIWMEANLGITTDFQNDWWNNATHKLADNSGTLISNTFIATSGTIFTLFMSPVFAVLFLYNRTVFISFLQKIAGEKYAAALQSILRQTTHTYFNFIKGMSQVYLIVGLLNTAGLLALGIKHALLFGMLTAVMTIIPYAGIIISSLLPISVAWISKDSVWYPIGVIAVFVFVQYLEANIIFPKVVAAQLNLSTWTTLVVILAGGILWGLSGMVLFIPFAGMLKLVLDHLDKDAALNILLSR